MEESLEQPGIFRILVSTGMVGVPSGIVTSHDMDRADEAATEMKSILPEFFPRRKFHVLSDGREVQDPTGMQSSILHAVWWRATLDVAALDEMVEKLDGKQ